MSSVKVAVRVRPFNEREKGSKPCVIMVSQTPQETRSFLLCHVYFGNDQINFIFSCSNFVEIENRMDQRLC